MREVSPAWKALRRIYAELARASYAQSLNIGVANVPALPDAAPEKAALPLVIQAEAAAPAACAGPRRCRMPAGTGRGPGRRRGAGRPAATGT